MNHLQQAIEFRKTFCQPILKKTVSFECGDENKKALLMQIGCIQEEGYELIEALFKWIESSESASKSVEDDKAEMIKELADLIYVCFQLAAFLGIEIDEALDRVHESNMTKADETGRPIFNSDGKVMKGPRYKKPDLSDLV